MDQYQVYGWGIYQGNTMIASTAPDSRDISDGAIAAGIAERIAALLNASSDMPLSAAIAALNKVR